MTILVKNATKAQPGEIFALEIDFSRRLTAGEALSVSDSVVIIVDPTGADVTSTFAVGSPSSNTTKLIQKIKWAEAAVNIGKEYKVTFRAKTGPLGTDSIYEEDVYVTIFD